MAKKTGRRLRGESKKRLHVISGGKGSADKLKSVDSKQIPSLSACMMVKDEEKNLPRCLNSIKDVVDEIIVVDTGSTDKTIEIAESFGAEVYRHPWEDDFSKHRNQSIGYATKDWIFIIDADEELKLLDYPPKLVKETLAKIPDEHPAGSIEVCDIQGDKVVMRFTSARFFRNDGEFHYDGIVHNQPVIRGYSVFCAPFYIDHHGYDLTAEQKKEKFERTSSLLHKRLEEDPDDSTVLFYLCQIYANSNRSKEAMEWAEKYVQHRDELKATSNFNPSIYFTAVGNYMRLENRQKAYEWLMAGLEELPEDLDLTFAKLEYAMWTGNEDMGLEAAEQYVKVFEKFETDVTTKKNRFVYTHRVETLAYGAYCLCSGHMKKGAKALALFNNLMPQVPQKISSTLMLQLKQDLEKMPVPVHVNLVSQGGKVVRPDFQQEPTPLDLSKVTLQGGSKKWE